MAGLGCKIGKTTVPLDDLAPATWMEIAAESIYDWSDIYVAPLRDLNAAVRIVAECVKIAEPSADPGARAAELTKKTGQLAELFVDVEDDLPNEIRDGVPTGGDGSSTSI